MEEQSWTIEDWITAVSAAGVVIFLLVMMVTVENLVALRDRVRKCFTRASSGVLGGPQQENGNG